MNTRRRSRRRFIAEINVVPYIDVMLVLLIIFMVTAPLLQQGVAVDLPEADSQPLSGERDTPLVLSVDRHGRYYLNIAADPGQALEPDRLQQLVAGHLQRNPQAVVQVKADTGVDYGTVVRAMVLLQQAGAPRVGLLTDPVRR